ncbi:MAG: hypothetical protein JJE25_09140 [Bacteroidia bacterium]|nr:hypothetical protein [Bacteroidia bacterium]
MIYSRKLLFRKNLTLAFVIAPAVLFAQENLDAQAKPAKEFVKGTFENGVVINNQTVENTRKKSLDFMIQHRFGVIKDEKDFFGLFAPSNIRLGLTYGITNDLSVGIGATKNKYLFDLQGKYIIFKQTKQKGIPVTVTYYGDVAKSARDNDLFLNQEGEYKVTNKLSYFHELMIARKINSKISLQLAATYSYFNIIDSVYAQHEFYGVSFVGRYRFSPQSSVIVDFDYLLNVSGIEETTRPKPNLSIGYEVSTGSHQFQIFICTADGIINQENRVFNHNEISERDFMLGFNITREWGFK